MTRDELIAKRLAAARKFSKRGDTDWAEVERRIAADIDAHLSDSETIRDQSQPEHEDELKGFAKRDRPAKAGSACGGGRRVIRKANGLS